MISANFKYLKVIFNILIVLYCNCLIGSSNYQSGIEDSIQKYLYNDPLKAKLFAFQYLENNQSQNNHKEIVTALYYLASINSSLSYADSANYYYDKAIIKSYSINEDELVLKTKMGKAGFLYQNYDFNNSLILYNEALQLATKLRLKDFQTSININIARLKYETGKYEEALNVFKQYYNENIPASGKATMDYYLAKTYLKLNNPDSSFVYINKGMNYCKASNDKELEIFFLNEYGEYLMVKEKYSEAQEKLTTALKKADEINSEGKKVFIKLSLAKLYTTQGETEKSISILKSTLIEKEELKLAPEELSKYYKLLAENYKDIDSLERSNEYFQKYVDEENKKSNKKFSTIQDLHRMDLNKVNIEKESYLKQKIYLSILVLVLFALLTIFIIIYRKKQKINEDRFTSLMGKIQSFEAQKKLEKNKKEPLIEQKIEKNNSLINENALINVIDEKEEGEIENNNNANQTENINPVISETSNENAFVIKDEKITEILENLVKLENKKYYLKQDFTLHSAAKKLKTNTAYLSKIVNNELGKNFSTYLNELRINYIILELKNNSKLRAYSVNSIAEEIGYKSADSFTKYFKAATGLTPSVYINKINDFNLKNKE